MMTTKKHGIMARLFHWGFIVLFVYAISKGLEDIDDLQDTALLHFEMIFATVFLGVLAARYFFMRYTMPSAMPDTNPKLKRLARWGHLAMYVSISMIAVTGLMIGGVFMAGYEDGFLISAITGLHVVFLDLSYLMIAGHIVMAVLHRLKSDGIWSSMVPVWTEKSSQ